MRTLKKTLCLVLCLAMMVGLCAIGASAIAFDDYKDKDKIQYEEAVTLLTALKVLEGDEKGFRPQDGLTRAEGAAIMTRMLTKATPTGTSSFTDMAGATWAQPYVKFCEDNGIIAGYGNGKFGPQDKLTTTQFAKMLICALGYDPAKEGMVDNAAWAINTTRKVTALGLADGLDAYIPEVAITREAAAQMAFNTLFQTMIYSDGTSYVANVVGAMMNGNVVVSVVDGTPLANTAYNYRPDTPDNLLQFCEASFPTLKVKTDEDVWGIPTNYWYQGKNAQDKVFSDKKVIAETIAADVLARYGDGIKGVTSKTIFNDACFESSNGDLEVWENGEQLTTDLTVYRKGDAASAKPLAKYAGAEAILLGENGEGYRLVVKYPYLAQVIAVQGGDERSVSLKIFKETPVVASYETEDFAKGDYVLVYLKGALADTKGMAASDDAFEILDVKAADAKNGTLTKVTLNALGKTATALTVGGTSYNIGAADLAVLGPVDGQPVATDKDYYELKTGMTAYMANGYILGVVADAVAYGDYVFVLAAGKKSVKDAFGKTTDYAGYVKQDATAVEAVIGDTGANRTALLASDEPMKWYSPTVGKTSTVFGADPEKTVPATINGLSKDRPALDDAYTIITDAKTAFVLNTAKGFKAYTGYAAVPAYEGTAIAYALVPSEGAHAIAVYIDVTGMTAADTAAEDPIYILKQQPGTKELDDDTTVYTYKAVVDGKLTTINSTVKNNLGEDAGLVIPTYNAKKYVTGVENVKEGGTVVMLTTTVELTNYKDYTLKLDEAYFAVNDATVVYLISATGKLSTVTPESLNGMTNALVTAISVSTKDKTLKTVYFDLYNGSST